MKKEIRENVEITIYTENERANVQTKAWYLENNFTDYITAEDYQKKKKKDLQELTNNLLKSKKKSKDLNTQSLLKKWLTGLTEIHTIRFA